MEIMREIASEFVSGAACTVVVNRSADSSMNKGRGANRNPFMGRVMLRKIYCGYVMDTSYVNSLLNTAGRMGNEDVQVNLKDNWHEPVADKELAGWFETDKRTHSKYYLKLQRNEKQVACKTYTFYYVDGRPATQEEVYLIKSWLKKDTHKMSSTQVEMGIDQAHRQHYILPQVDTITCIKQGKRTWLKQGFSLTSVMVKKPAYTHSQG